MNRIKAGVLLAVAWAVTVLLSSCGEKETGPVLSAYDYGHQAGEEDEIVFENTGADIRGIRGDVLFFAQEASSSVMRYFAANLQTAEIGVIGDTPSDAAWGIGAGQPVQVGDSYYLVGTGRLKGKGVIYRFSLEKQGMTACIAEKGVAYSDLAEQDGKLYYWARETRESHANDPVWIDDTVACYDPASEETTVLIEKKNEGQNPFCIGAMAAANGKIYVLAQEWKWTQADNGKWRRGWLLEVYDLSGRLVQKVPMAEAEEGFFDKFVRDFQVFGDYVLLSNSLEMALYRLTGDDAQLVAKSGWPYEEAEKMTPFSPAQSTVPQNGRALFCAHHFFWILDAAQEQVMILPVPGLEDGSGSYCNSVFTDGKNVVYSIYHAGLPNRFTEYRILPWDDLEHSVSQTISLEPGKVVDLGPYSYCERFEKAEAADPRETP